MGKLNRFFVVKVTLGLMSLLGPRPAGDLAPKSFRPIVYGDTQINPEKYSYFDIANIDGREKRLDAEMDETWASFTGDSAGLSFDHIQSKHPYKLAAIAGEYLNLAENPLRIIITHSWNQFTDHTGTFFNREIDGLEESSVNSNIAIPTLIETANESGALSLGHFVSFETSLSPDPYSKVQSRRQPNGQAHINTNPNHEVLSPILEILSAQGGFEKGQYIRELSMNGQSYNVQLIVRQPDKDRLTLDLQVQEVGSLRLQRYALLYKKQGLTKLVSK